MRFNNRKSFVFFEIFFLLLFFFAGRVEFVWVLSLENSGCNLVQLSGASWSTSVLSVLLQRRKPPALRPPQSLQYPQQGKVVDPNLGEEKNLLRDASALFLLLVLVIFLGFAHGLGFGFAGGFGFALADGLHSGFAVTFCLKF